MTVSAQNSYISYTGNGSTAAYSWPYKLFAATDLKVYTVVIATGVSTLQTSGGGGTYDYNINGALNTVTLNNNLPATHKLYLTRIQNLEQPTDYIEGDAFPAAVHEDTLDKIVLQIQQQQEQLDRSFKLDQVNTGTTVEIGTIVSERGGKVLGFDSSGNLLATQEIGTYKGNWAASTAYKARALVKDTSNNNIYLCNTAHTSSGSQPISSNTDVAKWDLIVDAASATTSATNAASSATAAASSQTAAASSATAAASSQTAAASSATSAASSATTATTKASEASSSAASALSSKNAAATSETNAAASATSAAASAGGGAVKVTSSDTTPSVLNSKILVSGGMTKAVGNAGGNETLTLTAQAAEVYGFEIVDEATNPTLRLTTTNNGADNITSTAYAAFDDVIYGASGMSWSITADGDLRVTI